MLLTAPSTSSLPPIPGFTRQLLSSTSPSLPPCTFHAQPSPSSCHSRQDSRLFSSRRRIFTSEWRPMSAQDCGSRKMLSAGSSRKFKSMGQISLTGAQKEQISLSGAYFGTGSSTRASRCCHHLPYHAGATRAAEPCLPRQASPFTLFAFNLAWVKRLAAAQPLPWSTQGRRRDRGFLVVPFTHNCQIW